MADTKEQKTLMSRTQSYATIRRKKAILEAIHKHFFDYGNSPTIRYILEKTDITSTSVVVYYLDQMKKDDLIVMIGWGKERKRPVPIDLHDHIRRFKHE